MYVVFWAFIMKYENQELIWLNFHKFYQHRKQQMERNCWWKISTALHALQSFFLPATTEKLPNPAIDSYSPVDEGVTKLRVAGSTVGFLRKILYCFSSSQQGLQHALDRFSAACNQAKMKITIEKTRFYVSPATQASVHQW